MKRKLIKQGAGGLTVCLPKKWTDKNNLKWGNEIEMEIESNKLIINAEPGLIKKSINLDISNLHVKTIQRIIRSAYREGYTELNISFKNKSTEHIKHSYMIKEFPKKKIKKDIPISELIYDITRDLIGFEIVEQKESSIKVKQISKVDEEELNSSLRRVFRLIYELNENLTHNPSQKIISNIRMFIDYGIRLVQMGVAKSNEFKIYSTIKRFENITHIYEFLAVLIEEKKLEKATIQMLHEIGELIDFVHRAYYNFSRDKYDEFDKKLRVMYHKHNTTYNKASKEDLRIRQMLTSCAMDLTSIMDNMVSINMNKGIYSRNV